MTIVLSTPGVGGLGEVVGALREWQHDEAPLQLHPGDLGWFWRAGAEATAAAVRTWSRDGRILAVGLLDGPDLVRLATAPDGRQDEELARQLAVDVAEPERGVLPAGKVCVEAPTGARVRDLLFGAGWSAGEAWTPLRRGLTEPVKDPGVRIEVIGPELAHVRAAVHRASFGSPKFTEHRWHVMAAGLAYADARCLIAYDDQDNAVAAATVWSAGPGKPGLLEPLGVHQDHRGHGYGTAISVAAAAALQQLGSSCALVCTRTSNLIAARDPGSRGQHHVDQVADTVRVERFAGHEPLVEDRAEKRLRRKLGIHRCAELSVRHAPRDKAG
jgi:GNAT superfamily N-acetyltransferase